MLWLKWIGICAIISAAANALWYGFRPDAAPFVSWRWGSILALVALFPAAFGPVAIGEILFHPDWQAMLPARRLKGNVAKVLIGSCAVVLLGIFVWTPACAATQKLYDFTDLLIAPMGLPWVLWGFLLMSTGVLKRIREHQPSAFDPERAFCGMGGAFVIGFLITTISIEHWFWAVVVSGITVGLLARVLFLAARADRTAK